MFQETATDLRVNAYRLTLQRACPYNSYTDWRGNPLNQFGHVLFYSTFHPCVIGSFATSDKVGSFLGELMGITEALKQCLDMTKRILRYCILRQSGRIRMVEGVGKMAICRCDCLVHEGCALCFGTLGVLSFGGLGWKGVFFSGPGAVLSHLPRHVTSPQGYLMDNLHLVSPCSNSCNKSSAVQSFRPTRPPTEGSNIFTRLQGFKDTTSL